MAVPDLSQTAGPELKPILVALKAEVKRRALAASVATLAATKQFPLPSGAADLPMLDLKDLRSEIRKFKPAGA